MNRTILPNRETKASACLGRRRSYRSCYQPLTIGQPTRFWDMTSMGYHAVLQHAQIEVVAVDFEQVEMARLAWRKYGKGRHPAALNFGDCFAYALAKTCGEPLLAKGNAFGQTDLELCGKT